MLLRSIASAVLALPFVLPPARPIMAQTPSSPASSVNTDTLDARAFAILFRRENTYLAMAKAAASPDKPEASLNRFVPSALSLDAIQATSLEQIAGAWQKEVTPIRLQMTQAITAFHATFPNGRLRPGIDPTPPPQMRQLRAQIDQVTLSYRDQLRNALPEPVFQSALAIVRTKYGKNLGSGTGSPAPSGTGGEAQ